MKKLTVRDASLNLPTKFFQFKTTEELKPLKGFLGQDRAAEALHFGASVPSMDFNLFVMGPEGLGKHSLVLEQLEKLRKVRPELKDYCYVHNFTDPNKPLLIDFSAGEGEIFKNTLFNLVREAQEQIPQAFDSKNYQKERDIILDRLKNSTASLYDQLEDKAFKKNVGMGQTRSGLTFFPLKANKSAMDPTEFQRLSSAKKEEFSKTIDQLQKELQGIQDQVARLKATCETELHSLNEQVTLNAIGYLFHELKIRYKHKEKVTLYLDEVLNHMVTHLDLFLNFDIPKNKRSLRNLNLSKTLPEELTVYRVNLVISHKKGALAPVIYEPSPSFSNLFGRVEHRAEMGTWITDFTMIRPGTLHKANGGFLVIDARRILLQPFAWENLKRALFGRLIQMEPLERQLGLFQNQTLEPESCPLDIKVILVGDRYLYYLLFEEDPDFKKLFRVEVDFDEQIPCSNNTIKLYSQLIAKLVQNMKLKPVTAAGVKKLVYLAFRNLSDKKKMSISVQASSDILQEAHYYAGSSKIITDIHIEQAVQSKFKRNSRAPQLVLDAINRQTLLIKTSGMKTGQINALTVMNLGPIDFGHPSRISAQTRPGEGDIINIESEVDLSGPIQSKSVHILSGYLSGLFGHNKPLSMKAHIAFEQLYGGLEGDSASVAEALVLFSALAEKPLKQSLAITGSMNQHGEVQSVGAINEKIEGFFDVCKTQGLTGEQGVVLPHANVQHLLLKDEVLESMKSGRFHLYSIEHIDEAIKLFFGMPAGLKNKNGRFPRNSLHYFVDEKFIKYNQMHGKHPDNLHL